MGDRAERVRRDTPSTTGLHRELLPSHWEEIMNPIIAFELLFVSIFFIILTIAVITEIIYIRKENKKYGRK